MKYKIFLIGLFCILTLKNMVSQQTHQSMTFTLKYLLYLPGEYNTSGDTKWPLILFLHGAGERGDSLDLVKRHGPPKLVEEGKNFDFIIVSPQCPSRQWWSAELLNRLLDEIIAKYKVDEEKIYVTGLSMGGFGTWDLASEYPQRFAAIAPICGSGHPELAWNMRHIPAWVFHGAKDEVVSIGLSEIMVKSLAKYNDKVKFTVYPDAHHDSWTETYDNPKLYEWFLQNKKFKPEIVTTNKELLESLCGQYDFLYDNRHLIITTNGTDLFTEEIENIKLKMYPESKYEYTIRNRNGGITFQVDDKGIVTGLIYYHNGDMPARKVK
jgi:pimeloyl-ACP methyl ester carboxylesterase